MTQPIDPAGAQTPEPPAQPGIAVVAQPIVAPHVSLVQLRIVVGPSAFILELPPEAAEQLTAMASDQVGKAVDAIRRAQLGVPGLILPGQANGHRP